MQARIPPLGLNDALATPMVEVFDLGQTQWSYQARPSAALRQTSLPIPWSAAEAATPTLRCAIRSSHYWSASMAGQDFSLEDRLDADAFNTALWRGLAAGDPPVTRDGRDLRGDRTRMLGEASGPDCPRD